MRRPHVLLIDDDPMVLRALQRSLKRHYQVTGAASAQAAIELLAQRDRFDAVLCDLLMPGVSGAALHQFLLERDPLLAARMVFCTGGATSEEAARFVAKLSGRVVEKTAGIQALRSALDAVMAQSPRPRATRRTASSMPPARNLCSTPPPMGRTRSSTPPPMGRTRSSTPPPMGRTRSSTPPPTTGHNRR